MGWLSRIYHSFESCPDLTSVHSKWCFFKSPYWKHYLASRIIISMLSWLVLSLFVNTSQSNWNFITPTLGLSIAILGKMAHFHRLLRVDVVVWHSANCLVEEFWWLPQKHTFSLALNAQTNRISCFTAISVVFWADSIRCLPLDCFFKSNCNFIAFTDFTSKQV